MVKKDPTVAGRKKNNQPPKPDNEAKCTELLNNLLEKFNADPDRPEDCSPLGLATSLLLNHPSSKGQTSEFDGVIFRTTDEDGGGEVVAVIEGGTPSTRKNLPDPKPYPEP